MKSSSINRDKIEIIIYGLIWLLVFSVPYFMERTFEQMNVNRLLNDWLRLLGFLIAFLINVYYLVPKLLFNKKYKLYFVYISIIISFGICGNLLMRPGQAPPQNKPQMIDSGRNIEVTQSSIHPTKPTLQIFVDNFIIFVLILGVGTTSKLIAKWLSEEKLRKDIEKEQIRTNLELLKNQLNPHFLFNNLSVLSSLIYKNQDKAVDFVNELSKVYRYILDNKSSELVTLQEELAFLLHYIYLLKIRFESGISFSINIDKNMESAYLPPMCLQMLVENTIQHNETSQENPLNVAIYTDSNSLIIENPILIRTGYKESSKTGLENIQTRYAFFTDRKVDIINDTINFKVILPLIENI